MDKQLIERIALEVCDPLDARKIGTYGVCEFAHRFLARIDAEQGKDAVAWLHESRREADVITTAVKNVWGGVAVGNMAAYSIPLFLSPTPTIPDEVSYHNAPGCLNTGDKAMWTIGWNACRDAMLAATGELGLKNE